MHEPMSNGIAGQASSTHHHGSRTTKMVTIERHVMSTTPEVGGKEGMARQMLQVIRLHLMRTTIGYQEYRDVPRGNQRTGKIGSVGTSTGQSLTHLAPVHRHQITQASVDPSRLRSGQGIKLVILPMILLGARRKGNTTSSTTLPLTGRNITGDLRTLWERSLRQKGRTGFGGLLKGKIQLLEKLLDRAHLILRPNCGLESHTTSMSIWGTSSPWSMAIQSAKDRLLSWAELMMAYNFESWTRQIILRTCKFGTLVSNITRNAFFTCIPKGRMNWRFTARRSSVINHRIMNGGPCISMIKRDDPNIVKTRAHHLVLWTQACGSNIFQNAQGTQTLRMKSAAILIMGLVLINSAPVVMCAPNATNQATQGMRADRKRMLEEDPDAIDLQSHVVANFAKNIVPVPKYLRGVLGYRPVKTSVDMVTRAAPPPYRGYPDGRIDDTAVARSIINYQKSNLNTDLLEYLLVDFPNPKMVQYILSGLRIGFPKPISGNVVSMSTRNHRSLGKAPDILVKEIQQELAKGRRHGPFAVEQTSQFNVTRTNPIGLIPKPTSTLEMRVVHDQSYPGKDSLNSKVLREDFAEPFNLDGIDIILNAIRRHGRGCVMWTEDVKSAYRQLNIRITDVPLQGLTSDPNRGVYYDSCLMYGSREAGFIFCYFAGLICWILQKYGLTDTSHYVDNFTGVLSARNADQQHARMHEIFTMLRIPLNPKDSQYGTRVHSLGFTIDTVNMTISLREDKKMALQSLLLWAAMVKKRMRTKTLQSLVGKLSHASQIMPLAHHYLRSLYTTIGRYRKRQWSYLTSENRHDIRWFFRTFEQWDGFSLIHELTWRSGQYRGITGDACPIGGGSMTARNYAYHRWCSQCADISDSQTLEMANMIIAVLTHSNDIDGRRIVYFTDNAANVSSFSKGKSNDPFVTDLIRFVATWMSSTKILVRLIHVSRDELIGSDLLSRGSVREYEHLYQNKNKVNNVIPNIFDVINETVCIGKHCVV